MGRNEIHDRLAWVAVSWDLADRAAKGLDRGRIKKRRYRVSRVDLVDAGGASRQR